MPQIIIMESVRALHWLLIQLMLIELALLHQPLPTCITFGSAVLVATFATGIWTRLGPMRNIRGPTVTISARSLFALVSNLTSSARLIAFTFYLSEVLGGFVAFWRSANRCFWWVQDGRAILHSISGAFFARDTPYLAGWNGVNAAPTWPEVRLLGFSVGAGAAQPSATAWDMMNSMNWICAMLLPDQS